MPCVIHFELPADDPDGALKFHSKVFDWKIEKWAESEDYWRITTGNDDQPGINGIIIDVKPTIL